jgi:Ni/Fe-hydrogenase subunit HybB-like protein
MSTLACLGGLTYRFVPTTIAFNTGRASTYFPALPEVLMTVGYIALAIMGFGLAVKYFAVLPGETEEWNYMSKLARIPRAPIV